MPVRSFLHYALTVPDQSEGQRFYTDFGFVDASGSGNVVRLRPVGLEQDQILLYDGPTKKLHHLTFGAAGEDYAAVRTALRQHGVGEIDPPAGSSGGTWFVDPDGNLVNVRDEEPATLGSEPPALFNGPGSRPRIAVRAVDLPLAEQVRPRRLGHVMLFSPDVDRQRQFYSTILGLRISDDVPGIVTFMRCSTDHHNLAFIRSHRPGFHHGSFEVGDIDEIAIGALRMQEKGWIPGWGLGRHAIGSNFFFYIRDPWGSFAEYFFDLDYIPDDAKWEARQWDARFALYAWGPAVPADFEVNTEQ